MKARAKRVKHHVTIREVAKAAGASVSTISAALNNSDYVSAEMRSRIEGAIRALRYRPNDLARGLRLQKTHSIAIVVPDLSNNFYIELVRGAKDYSASANYTVLIGDSRESWEEERNYLDSFHRRRVDGVVRVPAINAAGGKARSVLGNLPVVYADRHPLARDSYIGRVGVDNTRAAESATRYLLSLGHRQIGVIAGDASSGTSLDRLQGFMRAIRSAKIRPDRSMIVIRRPVCTASWRTSCSRSAGVSGTNPIVGTAAPGPVTTATRRAAAGQRLLSLNSSPSSGGRRRQNRRTPETRC